MAVMPTRLVFSTILCLLLNSKKNVIYPIGRYQYVINMHDDLVSHSAQQSQPQDPRHVRRVNLMQRAFAYTFLPSPETQQEFVLTNSDMKIFIEKLDQLDQEIQVAATERPLAQVNKVDLAILRTIMFEWETTHTPIKVLINEAVEIAKEFGTDSSPKFVNGVLAKLLTEPAVKPETIEG